MRSAIPDQLGIRFALRALVFDGSQDWVIAHNDVVAGSSPASGTKCRSSSVVEHVTPSSIFIRHLLFSGDVQPQPSTTEALWQTTCMLWKTQTSKSPASAGKGSHPKHA